MNTTHIQRARRRLLLAASLVALLLIPAGAGATPGVLDPGFGTGGKVTTAFGSGYDTAYAIAVQRDGKLVAAGSSGNGSNYDFALARYHRNGTLDTSFGSGGKVTTAIGSSHDSGSALVLQPDGKLVVAGYASTSSSTSAFALARYHPSGTLDPGFGAGGKVMTALGSGAEDGANALALQPDGKLVAAGAVSIGSRSAFALARYNRNGSLDTSFGQGGKVTTAIGSGWGHALALVVQQDGRLVVAGAASDGSDYDLALLRYNANGTLDPSFGSGGLVTTEIGPGYDSANAIALRPGGKLVVAGQSWNGSRYDLLLARYSPNGTLDPSFGSGGKATTAISSGDAVAKALAVQPDGKLVAAGTSSNAGLQQFALARFSPNGTLDPSFGSEGKVTTAVGPDFDGAYALALQPDGKVVAAGTTNDSSGSDFALVRYLGSTVACVVPKLKGKTLRAAKRALTKAHCSVGKRTRASSPKVGKGRVIASKPGAGRTLARGAKVGLQVSKGKK
jgi:uncharacterized delta-60 repeat protein